MYSFFEHKRVSNTSGWLHISVHTNEKVRVILIEAGSAMTAAAQQMPPTCCCYCYLRMDVEQNGVRRKPREESSKIRKEEGKLLLKR
jgi:hypothetical protein